MVRELLDRRGLRFVLVLVRLARSKVKFVLVTLMNRLAWSKGKDRHLRESGLPAGKTFTTFEFSAVPTVRKAHMMNRVLAYTWFSLVIGMTSFLPDVKPVLKLRGWLVRGCFRSCGRNFQVAADVRILFTNRVDIGHDVYIAPGCWLQGVGGVQLCDEVMLGPYTVLATPNHTKIDGSYRFWAGKASPISLGRGAWTGAHVVVTAGCTIGEGAAVAAGAVVTKNVPPHSVVGGVPARVLATSADEKLRV